MKKTMSKEDNSMTNLEAMLQLVPIYGIYRTIDSFSSGQDTLAMQQSSDFAESSHSISVYSVYQASTSTATFLSLFYFMNNYLS